MKSSVRAAVALGVLALASAQASASIYHSGDTITLNPGSDDLLASVTYYDAPFSVFYLDSTSSDNFLTFSLRDTDDEDYTVNYSLKDSNDTILAQWALTDNVAGTFSYLLTMGNIYTLRIDTDPDVSSSTIMTSAVPLPAAAWLFGSALLGLGALRRKQKAGAKSDIALT